MRLLWVPSLWLVAIALAVAAGARSPAARAQENAAAPLVSPSPDRPLRLTPRADVPPLEGSGWRTGPIFDRIDSLAALLDDPDRTDRGALAFRIAQLYLATNMFKHRRTALEYLDQAIALDPSQFEAFRLRAVTAEDMEYPAQATKWFAAMTRAFPHDARGYVSAGRFELLQARSLVDPEKLARARDAFARAVASDSTSAEAWLGWGGCSLVLGDYAAGAAAGLRLTADPGLACTGWLLLGASRTGLRQDDDAWDAFSRGIEQLDAPTADLFLQGEGFVMDDALRDGYAAAADSTVLEALMLRDDSQWTWEQGVDLKKAGRDPQVRRAAVEAWWRDRNPWPTHLANRHRLAFWQRLVEADLLFGDPETGNRGWDTEPGLAWVRWGPPTETRYEAPGWGSLLDTLEGTPIRGEILDTDTGYWMWIYRLPPNSFGLVFRDITYRKRWMTTGTSRQNLLAWGKRAPLMSDRHERREPSFTVAFSSAGFQRGPSGTTLETYIGVRPLPLPPVTGAAAHGAPTGIVPEDDATQAAAALGLDSTAVALVELAIFDAQHRRVHYVRQPLPAQRRRGWLLRALGDPAADAQEGPLLLQVSAQLSPGEYEIALDVSDARDGAHRGLRGTARVEPFTTGQLALSDLELASSFAPYTPDQAVLSEFVKYDFSVLPVPDGVVAAAAANLFVYYEVYNLATDTSGHTRFNVTYEVYRDREHDRQDKPLAQFRRDGADRVDPLTVTFVEETSGVSQQRHVVKGAAVDIAPLPPGRYVLVVSIDDLLSGERCHRYRPFRKSKPEAGVQATAQAR